MIAPKNTYYYRDEFINSPNLFRCFVIAFFSFAIMATSLKTIVGLMSFVPNLIFYLQGLCCT